MVSLLQNLNNDLPKGNVFIVFIAFIVFIVFIAM